MTINDLFKPYRNTSGKGNNFYICTIVLAALGKKVCRREKRPGKTLVFLFSKYFLESKKIYLRLVHIYPKATGLIVATKLTEMQRIKNTELPKSSMPFRDWLVFIHQQHRHLADMNREREMQDQIMMRQAMRIWPARLEFLSKQIFKTNGI